MLLVTWWVTWLQEYIERCDLDPEKIEGSKGPRVKILDAGAAVVIWISTPTCTSGIYLEMSTLRAMSTKSPLFERRTRMRLTKCPH
jgi:hypothetical protein